MLDGGCGWGKGTWADSRLEECGVFDTTHTVVIMKGQQREKFIKE